MANEVGALNGVAFGNIGALNSVAPGNIAAIDGVQFVATVADSISINKTYGVFNSAGELTEGDDYIQVTSSGAWTSTILYDSGSGWAYRNPTSGSTGQYVTISVDGDYYDDERTATIRFTCGTEHADYSLSQWGFV